jgi:hypothetical protein
MVKENPPGFFEIATNRDKLQKRTKKRKQALFE